MNDSAKTILSLMENVDSTLLGLSSMLRLTGVGAREYNDGEMFEEVIDYLVKAIQGVRAELDEAMTAAVLLKTSA